MVGQRLDFIERELCYILKQLRTLRREQQPLTDFVITGRVKWYNVKQGYGFITRDDNGEDIFVHRLGIKRNNSQKLIPSLGDGESVWFDVGLAKGRHHPEAFNVTGPFSSQVQGSHHSPNRQQSHNTSCDVLLSVIPESLDADEDNSDSEDTHMHDIDFVVNIYNEYCDTANDNVTSVASTALKSDAKLITLTGSSDNGHNDTPMNVSPDVVDVTKTGTPGESLFCIRMDHICISMPEPRTYGLKVNV